jgi:hypothetical protein
MTEAVTTRSEGDAMPTTMIDEPRTYRTQAARPARGRGHALREGVVVGLIGAAIAMVLFLIVDVAAGMPLRTPAMLGAALFHGVRGGGAVTVTAPLVLGYTLVHLAGFVAFGLAVSGLFALAEREKRVLALIFMLGCCLAVLFGAMVYVLAQWLREALTPWIFLSGHLLAAAGVVVALTYFHGRLIRQFPEAGE